MIFPSLITLNTSTIWALSLPRLSLFTAPKSWFVCSKLDLGVGTTVHRLCGSSFACEWLRSA